MERGNIGRWLLIAAGVFLVLTLGKRFTGGGETSHKAWLHPERTLIENADNRPPEQICDLWGERFHAQLTTRGASLKHYQLTTAKYQKGGHGSELSTTPDLEFRRQLRFGFANGIEDNAADRQLEPDSLDWNLELKDGKSCEFVYRDAKVELKKTVRLSSRPYELAVDATVTNLAPAPRRHALTVNSDAWRTHHEVTGGMFKQSPLLTQVECVQVDGTATRLHNSDFEPSDFEDKQRFPVNPLNAGDWYQGPGNAAFAAVSNAYFSQALVPLGGNAGSPVCQLQIEDRWDSSRFPSLDKDPQGGSLYRARLAYPAVTLAPGQTARYSLMSYVGPMERALLAHAAGGDHRLDQLIDLGFFSPIAKILVAFLLKVHGAVGNWGIAIIVLTITARTLLFPLTLPSIKSTIKMRELKPEIDALNERFKDDQQAKGLAQMELWRKHNINPLKGCLPQLASMPVWFALYRTLQTAVELYNIPFLWLPDLSAADPLYILPFVIGCTSFMQQRLMPPQGDPAQQKMMLYFMPAIFTVFMLFLPAGLGVYMFTNGVLGILQQQAVEWHTRKSVGKGKIKVEVLTESARGSGGSAGEIQGTQGQGKPKSKSDDAPLLGNGKA